MSYCSQSNFEEVESIKTSTINAERQIELIHKYQKELITQDEKNELIGQFHKMIIKSAKSFSTSLPDRSFNDIISDGVSNVWMRLLQYDEYREVSVKDKEGNVIGKETKRVLPSTYVSIVLRTGYVKDIKKSQTRMSKRLIRFKNSLGETEEKISCMSNMSLQNFVSDEDQEFEPDSMSIEDNLVNEIVDEMTFNSMVLQMYNSICKSLQDYEILNSLLDVHKLPATSAGRNRQCVEMIAKEHGVQSKTINKVAKRVGPWLDKFDFIPHLLRGEFKAPAVKDVFDSSEMSDIMENEVDDVWDIMKADRITEEV
jgi:hypothetical protein